MKKLLLSLSILVTIQSMIVIDSFAQQAKERFLTSDNILVYNNGTYKPAQVKDYKGKIVILEFWATWCGPCIEAMPHIDSLQKKYSNDLVIIALSNEDPAKVAKFIKKKNYSFTFGLDEQSKMSNELGIVEIPTSVILDKTSKIVTTTYPKKITNQTINKILAGENVYFESPKTFLELLNVDTLIARVKDTTKEHFSFDPGQPSIIGSFKKICLRGIFKDRRITSINIPLSEMFSDALVHPKKRLIFTSNFEKGFDSKEVYNSDFVVANANPDELRNQYKEKLLHVTHSVIMKKEGKLVDVLVLRKISSFTKKIENSMMRYPSTRVGADSASFSGFTIKELCAYIENDKKIDYLVEDESGLEGKFDITIPNYVTSSLEEINKSLAAYGLKFLRTRKKIEFIYIDRK